LLDPGTRHFCVLLGPAVAWVVKVTINPIVFGLVTATDRIVLGAR
jgi:hypothetical protein